MPPAGFEPTISAGERLQTHALDRAATGTGPFNLSLSFFLHNKLRHDAKLNTGCILHPLLRNTKKN